MTRLERLIGIVLRGGVLVSSVCLTAGLAASLAGAPAPLANGLLQIGILVLLATPVARVVISVVEYTVDRDWMFATLTLIVLVELMASVVAAVVFNRRI